MSNMVQMGVIVVQRVTLLAPRIRSAESLKWSPYFITLINASFTITITKMLPPETQVILHKLLNGYLAM